MAFLCLWQATLTHDTFARIFARIDPQQFQECFLEWIQSISTITEGEAIAIDGKTLRRSYDKSNNPLLSLSADNNLQPLFFKIFAIRVAK